MIIKGSARGQSIADTAKLARHLVAADNEVVTVLEVRGTVAGALPEALEELRLLSLASRSRRALYHASINLGRAEAQAMSPERWREAADELERRLGLVDHQRVLVQHVKRGRPHLHVVWGRVHPTTLKVAHDGHTYPKHEACARVLEQRWRLAPVTGVHTRPNGIPRPVAAASHRCWQAQERTGVAVAEVAAALRRCWDTSEDGRAFAVAVTLAGLRLAHGRRGIVAVDPMGTPHALPRRLGLRADAVRRKLADLGATALPSVEDTQAALKRQTTPGRITMPNITACIARPPRRRRAPDEQPQPLTPDYWRRLGFEVEPLPGALIVTLPGGTRLQDRGDALVLHRSGDPTPEETRLMVTAARERGWDAIHFSGGSPDWQRQARLEALKQGFPLTSISLACEDSAPPATATAMPTHIRRRLLPESPEEAPAAPDIPVPAAEAPVPGYRP